MCKIAVIIPCYNEESTILQVIDEVHTALPKAQICVFDNNSSDNSLNLVKNKITEFANNNYLQIFSVSTQGKGAVIREAFALLDSDIYIMIDADTQYDTSFLPTALTYFIKHHLDMLNIARETIDDTIYRRGHNFGNKLISKTAQMLFKKNIIDMLSGYRIFSRGFVKSFPAHSNGFEIETELTIFALQQNLRIDEIKAPYKSRPEGSFSKLSTFKDGFKILFMIAQLLFSERPLFIFGILSAVCLLICFGFGIPIVIEFLETSKVPRFPTLFACIGFGIISIILLITGFLAFLISRNTKEMRRYAYHQAQIKYN